MFFFQVIDFCLVKQMTCDWSTKYCCLQTVWASQASLNQRKGRSGRVSSGRCYRLITSDFFHNHIPEYSVPEMQVGVVLWVHDPPHPWGPFSEFDPPLRK